MYNDLKNAAMEIFFKNSKRIKIFLIIKSTHRCWGVGWCWLGEWGIVDCCRRCSLAAATESCLGKKSLKSVFVLLFYIIFSSMNTKKESVNESETKITDRQKGTEKDNGQSMAICCLLAAIDWNLRTWAPNRGGGLGSKYLWSFLTQQSESKQNSSF